jgi:S-adenosylmethionine uptake transporter
MGRSRPARWAMPWSRRWTPLAIVVAYRKAPAIIIAPMQYSQIGWAALFGALIFGETMSGGTVLGCVLIALAGIVVVARQDRVRAAAS